MRKWEKDYQEFSNSEEMEEKLAILEDKINRKVAFKEEYAEYKKLNAIKQNLPKVKNILELREKLDKQNQEIKTEIKNRELLINLNKANEVLDQKMSKLEEEQSKLEEELKDKNLSVEDRNKKQQQLKEIEAKKQENNIKFVKCQEKFEQENSRMSQNKYKDISSEDLKEQSYQISIKVSKCNLACNKLMQGYSWDSIDLALEKFKDTKFTANKEQAQKIEAVKSAAKASVQKETVKEQGVKEEEKALAVQDEKTSVFSKVKGFFKKGLNWVKEKFAAKEDKAEQNKTEQDKPENEKKEEPKQKKEDDFRQYLKAVAEKGIDGVEEEKRNQLATSKEEEIAKAAERIVEARREAVEKAGGKFDEVSAMQKARKIAEDRYNKNHADNGMEIE